MSDQCTATIHAGPGHQSEHECVLEGKHHDHASGHPHNYEWSDCRAVKVMWSDKLVAYSGYFNESPGWCEGGHEGEK